MARPDDPCICGKPRAEHVGDGGPADPKSDCRTFRLASHAPRSDKPRK